MTVVQRAGEGVTRAASLGLALIVGAIALTGLWTGAASAKKRHHRHAHVASISCSNTATPMDSLSTSQISATIACLINRERASKGLSTQRPQSQLLGAATAHNADMQQSLHAFTHDASNGDSFEQRIGRSGYMRKARRWTVGEILDETPAANVETPTAALDAWLQSPTHNHVMHIAKFRDFGISTVRGTAENPAADGVLITVDFGYRKK
jgi:uncharacterized protein YkwD